MKEHIIHFIWLGSTPSQEDIARMDMWKSVGDINLVTEIPTELKGLADKAETWQAKSDLLRYWLVYQHGGTYLDTDCIPGTKRFQPPEGTYTAGWSAACAGLRWSNFVIGSDQKYDPFWEATLERCKDGTRSNERHHLISTNELRLYLYNIEYIWGTTPLVNTVPCRQGDFYENKDPYMVHHLCRTDPRDFEPESPPPVELKRSKPHVDKTRVNKMAFKCNGCPDFIQKKFCVQKRSYVVQECEKWNNPRGRYVRG